MKYRHNKVKREHGIIQDALEWLEELGQHPEVSDIIPGVIEAARSPERGLVYKYETATGCKLLLKSNGSVQEAFVVTKNPAWVKSWVEGRFSPGSGGSEESPSVAEGGKDAIQTQRKVVKKKSPERERDLPQRRPRTSKQATTYKQGSKGWSTLGQLDSLNLGEQLNGATRQALRTLQKSLEQTRSPSPAVLRKQRETRDENAPTARAKDSQHKKTNPKNKSH